MKASAPTRPIIILMAEDNPTDVLITKEGLLRAKMLNTLHVVEDGVEAMEFLRHEGKYADAPRPDLILLDLNMPRMGGQEVLTEIKTDEKLKHIPVVVLTTSKSDEDVHKAYGHHANCYIVKPVDFTTFTKVVQTIQDFWFCVVTLPPGPR
ncbi:response regulator [Prosthecobacter sp.]|uniref:response regulator n=1 Tax=Prosthecobacter sp. TaxID=1965333 RepID=UPI002ABC6027|nr:response regulator [Prosthecobacter sp.]MDZ4405922.1 response regulator [Prosthecobacter sp.]